MRPLPRRLPSRSAAWALRLSVFAPILAVISWLAHRSDVVDTPTFFVLLVVIGLIALIGLFFVFLAFRSLWINGKRGGRKATWAFFFSALLLAPYVYGATLWVSLPKVVEVSTDLVDPPATRAELLSFGARTPTMIAAVLRDAYPEITGRRYNTTAETVYERVLLLAEDNGWQLVGRRGRVGADADLVGEFTVQSMVLGMPRTIVVRVRDEGDTTFVDMRAKLEFGAHDLGANARLISKFIGSLDFALIGQSD